MLKPTVTNQDASRILSKKAAAALLESASEDWRAAKAATTEAGKLELVAVNRLRSCGVKLMQASDHQIISFTRFEGMKPQLPGDMTWPAFKFCVHVGKKFPEPVKDLEQARLARRQMFEAIMQVKPPRRIAPQNSHDHNPWTDFVSEAAGFTSAVRKLEDESDPMDRWEWDQLDTFIRETKPIVEKYNLALALREQKRKAA